MKVYHDHDGTRRYYVAARNLREAAALLSTTVGSIRRNGGRTTEPGVVAVCMAEPGVVFQRRMDVYPTPALERAPHYAGLPEGGR